MPSFSEHQRQTYPYNVPMVFICEQFLYRFLFNQPIASHLTSREQVNVYLIDK